MGGPQLIAEISLKYEKRKERDGTANGWKKYYRSDCKVKKTANLLIETRKNGNRGCYNNTKVVFQGKEGPADGEIERKKGLRCRLPTSASEGTG